MSVSAIGVSPMLAPGGDIEDIAGDPAAEVAAYAATEPLAAAPMAFAAFESLFQPLAAFAAAASYSEDDPTFTLVRFSKLSEARQLLGADVDTVFFRRVGDPPGPYQLEPLKAVRSTAGSLNTGEYGTLTYEPVGAAIPFTGAPPAASAFLNMNTLDQRAVIALFGTVGTAEFGSVSFKSLQLPADGDQPAITAVLSQDGGKVRIVERLQARDLGAMSKADQAAIAATPAFAAIAATLGLTTNRAEALAVVQAQIDAIKAEFPDNAVTTTATIRTDNSNTLFPKGMYVRRARDGHTVPTVTTLAAPVQIPGRLGFFTLEQRDLYVKQLELIQKEITDYMGVFNLAEIGSRTAAVKERFDTAMAFGNIPVSSADPDDPKKAVEYVTGYWGEQQVYDWKNGRPLNYHWEVVLVSSHVTGWTNIMSPDENQTIKNGFDNFIAQERIFHEVAASRHEIMKSAATGRWQGGATAIQFRILALAESIGKAQTAYDKEMIAQQNDFGKSISAMSQIISKAVAVNGDTRLLGAEYNKNAQSDLNYTQWKNYSGSRATVLHDPHTGAVTPYWSQEEAKIIAMFNLHNGAKNTTAPTHPLAKLNGIDVPRFSFVNDQGVVAKIGKEAWLQMSNQLTETSGVLNQITQSLTSKLNASDKDKNRSIEALSSSLRAVNKALKVIGNTSR